MTRRAPKRNYRRRIWMRITALSERVLRRLLTAIFGRSKIERFLVSTANLLKIDLVCLAYNDAGILNYENHVVSGEKYLYDKVLPAAIKCANPILYDVGANVGEVSKRLRGAFPDARVLAFEPNPGTFSKLEANVCELRVECFKFGVGSSIGTSILHIYADDPYSGHASVHRDMFEIYDTYGVIGAKNLISFEFCVTTVDLISKSLNVKYINFLKIDVEGQEFDVLRGAEQLIANGLIDVIQFEFTDCNVFSRVFMRDFYEVLPRYALFRLSADCLIPMGKYLPRYEIFQFQNILAIRSDLVDSVGSLDAGRGRFYVNC